MPTNGLSVFCGLVWDDAKGEKKIYVEIEPLAPLCCPEYTCDNRFHVETLRAMCAPQERFGFIVIGGRRCVLAVLCGSRTEVLETISPDLPTKTRMGGQSAVRFQRLADETRHNLCRLVSESAKRRFLTGAVPNVTAIIIAGCAQLKGELESSGLLCDPLRRIVIGTIDVSYDGEQGLAEAVKKSRHLIGNVGLVRDQRLLEGLFDDAGHGKPISFGLAETMAAWDAGAIATVFVWTGLETFRIEKGDGSVVYGRRDEFVEDAVGREKLVDWIVDHHGEIGCELELVGSDSAECAQFVKGLGGIAGRLRYAIDLSGSRKADADDFDSDFDL